MPRSSSPRNTRSPKRTRVPVAQPGPSPLTEIYGIAISALAVALAIALLAQERAVVPAAVASALRTGFGIGAYFVPPVVLAWGVTFFLPDARENEGRMGLGLLLSFVALITMFALRVAAPLDPATYQANGGLVGGLIAFALRSLLGVPIGYVVAGAAFVAGLVIAGLSITRIIEAVKVRMEERAGYREAAKRVERADRVAGKTKPLADPGAAAIVHRDEPEAEAAKPARAGKRSRKPDADDEAARPTVPTAHVVAPKAMEGFELPSLDLLKKTPASAANKAATERELADLGGLVESTLATFDIPAEVVGWTPGPTVTLFRVRIAKGVKVNRVTALSDDLALALAAPTIRILAPIPGESLIGIEVPNERRAMVTLGDVLGTGKLADPSPLLLGLGKDVSGQSIVPDLAGMPHLLIAGSTGTGKSVCINALLMSIIMRATPSEVRLILIDPKRIELSLYNDVPHLYVPVVTEPKQAASALAWAVAEMESRLKRLQQAGARNIAMYNSMVLAEKGPEGAEPMPYLVIVIDELADLMMVAAKEVEDSICRLAQLARAAGIHLIIATQRPSTDVITGLIKANITNRIAFAVSSSIDSRVILDGPGAEKLIGKGDMLYSRPEYAKPTRIQGAYVSEDETNAVVEHLKAQGDTDYHEEILQLKVGVAGGSGGGADEDDPLVWEAADAVVISGLGSTSMLQRRLSVGYARAGRIMDILESKGIVGPPNGSKPRDVLVDVEELESVKAFERQDAADA